MVSIIAWVGNLARSPFLKIPIQSDQRVYGLSETWNMSWRAAADSSAVIFGRWVGIQVQ